MTRPAHAFILSVVVVCLLANFGCSAGNFLIGQLTNQVKVKGSGVKGTEQRNQGKFNELDVSSAIHANVTIGDTQKIVVTADDNVVPLIKTEVRKKTLYVSLQPHSSISTKTTMEVSITVPELTAIDSSGATHVNVKGLSSDKLSIDASGAARIRLEGAVTRLDIDASGAAKIDASKAMTETVKVDSSGAAKIQVYSSGSVLGEASGASKITIAGSPHTVETSRSGAAKITELNE